MKYWNMVSLMGTTALPETTLKLTWKWEVVYDEEWTKAFLERAFEEARKGYQGAMSGEWLSYKQQLFRDDAIWLNTGDLWASWADYVSPNLLVAPPKDDWAQQSGLELKQEPKKTPDKFIQNRAAPSTHRPPSIRLNFDFLERQKITWILLAIDECLRDILKQWFRYHILKDSWKDVKLPSVTHKIILHNGFSTDFFLLYKKSVQWYNILKRDWRLDWYCESHGVKHTFKHDLLACFALANETTCNVRPNKEGVNILEIQLPPDLLDWLRDFPMHSFIDALQKKHNIETPSDMEIEHWEMSYFIWFWLPQMIRRLFDQKNSKIDMKNFRLSPYFSPYFKERYPMYARKVTTFMNELLFETFRQACIDWMNEL